MNIVQENNQVLYIWNGTVNTDIEKEVNQLKTIPNVKVNVENADRVQLADFSKSQFDVILANVSTGNTELITHLLKVVKPKGKVVFKDDSIPHETTCSNLLLSGFINITALENNMVVGEKPNYEIGSAAKLNFGANKAKAAAVWKLDVDDEDEQIDADELLDEEDKLKPTAESLRVCGTTGKRKACKDCSCGLAEELEAETKNSAIQNNTPKSSCGSCYLGDAFRCASCPYLGMPAFKPGEKILLSDSQMKADI